MSLRRHQALRKNALAKIEFFFKKAMGTDDQTPKAEVENRLNILEASYEELRLANDEIISHKDADPELNMQDNLKADEEYIQAKSHLQNLLPVVEDHNSTLGQSHVSPHQRYDFLLPRIEIAPFSGSYEDWPTFRDLFKSAVDSNTLLSEAQKMHHLKSLLKAEAANLVKHLPVTNENYGPAITLLKEKYSNSRAIINAQLKRLFSLVKLEKPQARLINKMANTISECIQAMAALRVTTSSWDPIIVHLIETKLDHQTAREWEYSLKGSTHMPTIRQMLTFLDIQHRILETAETSPNDAEDEKSASISELSASSNTTHTCALCDGAHKIFHCETFIGQQTSERIKIINDLKMCEICLKSNHTSANCRSRYRCKKCDQPHNTLLHVGQATAKDSPSKDDPLNGIGSNQSSCKHKKTRKAYLSKSNEVVLLATAIVRVRRRQGERELTIRALLDQGSQSTFITNKIAQQLKLPHEKTHVEVTGVGGKTTAQIDSKASLDIISRIDDACIDTVSVLCVPTITSLKGQPKINHKKWPHLNDLELADPQFAKQGDIDMLIGADLYSQIILPGLVKGPRNTPVAQETSLGWIVSGRTAIDLESEDTIKALHFSIKEKPASGNRITQPMPDEDWKIASKCAGRIQQKCVSPDINH